MAAADQNPVVSLLGDKLLDSDNEIDTASLCANNDAIGLYFSAHWCGPCRGFTPKLADAYKTITAAGKKFDVIFVSSDRDEAAFKEYYASMPWKALAFSERDRKAKLSSKFKVQGIPTLVILDAKTGEIITDDGRSVISSDPAGKNFPWRPKPFWEIFDNGTDLLTKSGKIAPGDLRDKVIGLYFSAHWCPPCRQFTPVLCETYKKIKGDGKNLEIVFVSGDRSEEEFTEYFGSHPWISFPFQDGRIEELNSTFKVRGIPSFILIDGATGKVINDKGRGAVMADQAGAEFPWKPKPLNELTGATGGSINSAPCLIVFVNEGDDEAALVSALKPIAEDVAKARDEGKEDSDLEFFYAKNDALVGKVRQFLSGKMPDSQSLMIICIPERAIYLSDVAAKDITSDVVREFVEKFKKGELKKSSI